MRIYLLIAAIAGGVTWLVTPLIRHVAIEIGAVGEVRARDVHTIPTPRMGGLGMLIGFAVATVFASRLPFLSGLFNGNYQMWVILAGGIMISLLGMADDLWDLDWMLKLAGIRGLGRIADHLTAFGRFADYRLAESVHGDHRIPDCRLD